MVIFRHFCYLFQMHKGLSVTVQNGITLAFCTNKTTCQTPHMVHDDIDITNAYIYVKRRDQILD